MVGRRELWLGAAIVLLAGCGLITPWPLAMALVASVLVACSGLEGVRSTEEGDKEYMCCGLDGRTRTCTCPAPAICNYGLGTTFCGNGTCFFGDAGTCPEFPDAGTQDAGRLESCCVDGKTSLCYCPYPLACNYGINVTFCPDGTCFPKSLDGGVCLPDAGT